MSHEFPRGFSPQALREKLLLWGFCEAGYADLESLLESCPPKDQEEESRAKTLHNALEQGMRTVLTAAFPIPTHPAKDDLSVPGDPHGLLAPFARENYYRRAVDLLKILEREIRQASGLAKRHFRIFVNSQLPEKFLARHTGIGFIGKNTLVITPSRGSLVILGGILLPFSFPAEEIQPAFREELSCGSCTLCIQACPVQALSPRGEINTARCLQALSTGSLPGEFREPWGTRLYGCQVCQDVCPWNKKINPQPCVPESPPEGKLGPSISLKRILSAGENVKELFRGSVLDQKWISGTCLLRNALVAAGNHPFGKDLLGEIREYTKSPDPELALAAEWSLNKLYNNLDSSNNPGFR